MTLKQLRIKKGLSQKTCAEMLGVSLRTYIRYEQEKNKQSTIKYHYMFAELEKYGIIDEQHGILTIDAIKNKCTEVFKNYEINYCYLFGSYAKGKANEKSDVDLLISTQITGLEFYEMVELLREKLCKKVDVLHQSHLNNNIELTNEILKDGIKIYG